MPPRELDQADRVRLMHMLEAARQAMEFAHGRTRSSLDSEPMFRRAVLHCLQEMGEAAVRIAPESRALAPAVPWNQIVGMRNRLVHVYFAVNNDLVWEVIDRDLMPLMTELEAVLRQGS